MLNTILYQIQETTRAIGIEKTLNRLESGKLNPNRAQIPITMCTFTHGRKLYLSPGIRMRTENHPSSICDAKIPGKMQTEIKWEKGEMYNTSLKLSMYM